MILLRELGSQCRPAFLFRKARHRPKADKVCSSLPACRVFSYMLGQQDELRQHRVGAFLVSLLEMVRIAVEMVVCLRKAGGCDEGLQLSNLGNGHWAMGMSPRPPREKGEKGVDGSRTPTGRCTVTRPSNAAKALAMMVLDSRCPPSRGPVDRWTVLDDIGVGPLVGLKARHRMPLQGGALKTVTYFSGNAAFRHRRPLSRQTDGLWARQRLRTPRHGPALRIRCTA